VCVAHDAAPADFAGFLQRSLDASWAGRGCRNALIVADSNTVVHAPELQRLLDSVGIAQELATVPAGEASKSLAQVARLYEHMLRLPADRHTTVVALGGGVIGDLAGFVAATFARGVSLFMIPTSLLAQVDSSVGGKVGINLPDAKNIVGAFHQPAGVWIDVAMLRTLPDRELRCGLAEVVKYGVILDEPFFERLERSVEPILAGDPESLGAVIARSCELKADVVTKDEREETGLRAVLNFGHTVGHAIEAVEGYDGRFRHGEAVAIGMVAEARLAQHLGWIGPDVVDRIERLLAAFGLPTAINGLDHDVLLAAMTRDKKNRAGKIRFVLPRRIGRVELTDVEEADIRRMLRFGELA
jgi:3-dehydroquinate synthase